MTIARASGQGKLLDVPPRYRIDCNAQARNAYGAAAQEIVCEALCIEPIPINGNCAICFDAENRHTKEFYEIKSVKKGGKVVVYDWRRKKEANAGVLVRYAILVHNVRGCRDGAQLFKAFAEGGVEIVVVDHTVVHALADQLPLQQIKTEHARHAPGATGYNRKGYKDGYRNVPIRDIKAAATGDSSACFFKLHGVNFDCVKVSYGK
jgi:hypothetical protein